MSDPAQPAAPVDPNLVAVLLPELKAQLQPILQEAIDQLTASFNEAVAKLEERVEALGPAELIKLANDINARIAGLELKLKHWL